MEKKDNSLLFKRILHCWSPEYPHPLRQYSDEHLMFYTTLIYPHFKSLLPGVDFYNASDEGSLRARLPQVHQSTMGRSLGPPRPLGDELTGEVDKKGRNLLDKVINLRTGEAAVFVPNGVLGGGKEEGPRKVGDELVKIMVRKRITWDVCCLVPF